MLGALSKIELGNFGENMLRTFAKKRCVGNSFGDMLGKFAKRWWEVS
jgi:hypothetical protein